MFTTIFNSGTGNANATELPPETESIQSFKSIVQVAQSGEVTVTETLLYHFSEPKHGIYRELNKVFTNQDGKKFTTPISILEVHDLAGTPYKFDVTTKADYVSIKIGDPKLTISGNKYFVIKYTIKGAVESYSDHDEIYFNATGNEWRVPILKSITYITLPSSVPMDSAEVACYTGASGTTGKDCISRLVKSGAYFETTKELLSNQGISVALKFPKGYVTVIPKEKYQDWSWISMIGFIIWYGLLPLSVFAVYLLKGRDPKINTAIPALFEAPKVDEVRLTPAEAGTLYDESADAQDISATIVDLAIRGFIKITEVKDEGVVAKTLSSISSSLVQKNFMLTKVEDYKKKGESLENLMDFEKQLLDGLFKELDAVTTSDLKNKFYTDAEKIKDQLYKGSVAKGFFEKNPNSVRSFWFIVGAVCIVTINIPFGLVSIIMAKAMPRKTQKGARAQVDVKGLRKFLTSQERQMEFMEMNWYLFEKLLPYAIALGVTETWAKRFEGLGQIPSDVTWYSGANSFNAGMFASSIGSFNNSVTNFSTPTRSSGGYSSGFGGGGFSGGGSSGGGGGGSW